MKKSIFFTLIIFLFLSANTLAAPAMSLHQKYVVVMVDGNLVVIPVALAILAEGIATWTAADVALVGGGLILTGATVNLAYQQSVGGTTSFKISYSSPDETLDVLTGGTGGGGKKPQRPRMSHEDQFILLINLAEAGYMGWLKLSECSGKQGGPTKEQVQDQLIALYYADREFFDQINKIQADYESGKMISIPVYRPGTMLFSHYIYAFKVDESRFSYTWMTPLKVDVMPGSDAWSRGIKTVSKAFEHIKAGEGTQADVALVEKFSQGDCFGDPDCIQLQNKVLSFLDDQEFLTEVYSNPELLQEFWALMKAIEILKKMPEGEAKEKLRDFICTRWPKLDICGGQYELKLEESFNLISMEDVPEEFVARAMVLEATFNSVVEEFNDGIIEEDEMIEKILILEEEATELLAEYIRDKARITQLLDPNQDPAEELIGLATKLLDILSQVEFLRKQLRSGLITKGEFYTKIYPLRIEYEKISKAFRETVKDGYLLPESVWEAVNNRAFNSNWVNAILADINGSRPFAKLKITLKIYQRAHRELDDIFIQVGLSKDWRDTGKWGERKK